MLRFSGESDNSLQGGNLRIKLVKFLANGSFIFKLVTHRFEIRILSLEIFKVESFQFFAHLAGFLYFFHLLLRKAMCGASSRRKLSASLIFSFVFSSFRSLSIILYW